MRIESAAQNNRTIELQCGFNYHISHGLSFEYEGNMNILPTTEKSILCRAVSTIARYTSDRRFS